MSGLRVPIGGGFCSCSGGVSPGRMGRDGIGSSRGGTDLPLAGLREFCEWALGRLGRQRRRRARRR